MQALEIETRIDSTGNIRLPEEYHSLYGKSTRLVLLFPEQAATPSKRSPGTAKGVLKVVSEDDGHLADFREYMR